MQGDGHAGRRRELVGSPEVHVHELRPRRLERSQGRAEDRVDARLEVPREQPGDPQPDAAQRATALVVELDPPRGGRPAGMLPGQQGVEEDDVVHGPRHGPGRVPGVGERQHSRRRVAPQRGPEPHDPAERGGHARAAPGVGGDRSRGQAHRHGHGRPAAGAQGGVRRVAGRAGGAVPGGAAEGQLVQGGLHGKQGPGLPQTVHHGGVAVHDVVLERPGAARGGEAGDVHDVRDR